MEDPDLCLRTKNIFNMKNEGVKKNEAEVLAAH